MAWASIRANVVPMAVLWSLAAVLVLSYYFVPGVADALAPIARWQTESGWAAAFLNRLVFAGVIPGAFLLSLRTLRPAHPLAVAWTQGLWCAVWGIVCNEFYALQAALFGTGVDPLTVLLKTAVDQFVWTVLVIAPANGAFFLWMGCDFSFTRTRRAWPRRFFRELVLPLLLPNWVLWIPVAAIIYAFPLPLQIQVSGVALSASMLVSLSVGRASAKRENPA